MNKDKQWARHEVEAVAQLVQDRIIARDTNAAR